MKIILIPESSVVVNVQKMHYTLQKIRQMVFLVKYKKNIQNMNKSEIKS